MDSQRCAYNLMKQDKSPPVQNLEIVTQSSAAFIKLESAFIKLESL